MRIRGQYACDGLIVGMAEDRAAGRTEVVRRRDKPLMPHGGIVVLKGNLAPSGAVLKPAAASPELLQHRGKAVVFDSIEDIHARML